MRRKALVVVGVSAAMLIGGVALASTAGAQETPGIPGLPGFSFPGFSWPFGGESDDDNQDRIADVRPQSHQNADQQNDSDDQQQNTHKNAQTHVAQQQQQQAAPQNGTAQQAPAKEPQQDIDVQKGTVHKNLAQQDTVQKAQSNVQSNAQQGTDLATASRETITAADVSESPASPVQQRVLFLVNQNRRKGGCDNLSLDRRLIDAANDHASDMARHDYFAHESRDGAGAGDRVTDSGYKWRSYGENIARGQESAWQVVNGWMHSPEHRENIMNCRLRQMGVGLAIAGDDTPYWVQDFATPMN